MKRFLLATLLAMALASPAKAAITFANLGTSANPDITSTLDQTSYSNSSWTPPTSGLILAFVTGRTNGATGEAPTMSGNNLTWAEMEFVLNPLDGRRFLTLFAANASGSTTGATTVDFGATTQEYIIVSFFHAAGVNLSGGVAAAFVQVVEQTGTSVTSSSITLSAAGSSANRPIAGFVMNQNEAQAPRANWTEADDISVAAEFNQGLETQYRTDAFETTASSSWTTSSSWMGIAAELKAAASKRRRVAPIIFQ